MQNRTIIIFIVILFSLALFIGGGLYWLKKSEKKTDVIKENKTECKFNGKTYQQGEIFLIRLSSGCSLCHCGEDGLPICEKTYCPKEAPNEQ